MNINICCIFIFIRFVNYPIYIDNSIFQIKKSDVFCDLHIINLLIWVNYGENQMELCEHILIGGFHETT